MPDVLVACEFSGIVRDAFTAQGFDAWSCDLLPSDQPGQHLQCDVAEVLDRGWKLMVAHPPCDHLSVSGARWFAQKRADGRQQQGIDFFMTMIEAPIPLIAVENPVGIMSTKFRKPDQTIQPYQFGHGETKMTCLWLKGLGKLSSTNVVSGRLPRVHYESPGPDRWKKRSVTYQGIADAMADQWSPIIRSLNDAPTPSDP